MCTCGRSRSVFNWINKSLFLSEVISVLYMSIDSRLQPTGVFNVENGSWIELYYKCSTHSYWHNSYISSFLRIRYIQTLHSYPLIFFLFKQLACLACLAQRSRLKWNGLVIYDPESVWYSLFKLWVFWTPHTMCNEISSLFYVYVK